MTTIIIILCVITALAAIVFAFLVGHGLAISDAISEKQFKTRDGTVYRVTKASAGLKQSVVIDADVDAIVLAIKAKMNEGEFDAAIARSIHRKTLRGNV